jgi:hypothetical protein
LACAARCDVAATAAINESVTSRVRMMSPAPGAGGQAIVG